MVSFSAPFDAYARSCFVNFNIPLRSTARSISSDSCTLNWQGQSKCESWCMHPSPSRRPLWLTAHGSTSDYCHLPWKRRFPPRLSLCLGGDLREGSMHESRAVGDGVVNHDESSVSAAVGSSTTDPQQHAQGEEPEAVTLVRRKRGRPKGSTSKKKVALLPTASVPSNTQAAVCSAEEASAAKAAPIENPICSGTGSNINISSKEDEVALGASNDSASLTPPWCPPTESPLAVGNRQQALREAALLEDSPPPARKISIARAASAAKKVAASATPRSEKREWVEVPRGLGQQQRASGGGAGAGAWPRMGAVANSVVYTGRALGGKQSSRSPSRRQPTRPTAGAADGDRSPPVGSFSLGEEGDGAVAGDGERERMPLLERAEVNAIIAASTPQGFLDAPVDGFTELDTVVNAKAALMAMLEDEGAEELGDLCESQELDAEFVAVTAAVPGGAAATSSPPRACDKITAMGAPQQEEEQEPWRHALSLKDRLSLTDDDVSRLQASRRTGLGAARGLEARLTSRSAGGPSTAIGYLLGELRMRPEEVREALLWWPPLLLMSERGAHAVAAWLQGGLGLSADDVCKMVKRNPAIVSCSIVHNLRPKLGWLQQELGLSRPKSIRLIVRCPAIFTLSIDDNMAPKVEWLETKLRLTKQQAARVVFANPGVLLSSVEGSLMPKIRWLAEALQMEEEMVFDMVRRYPMFFSLSSKVNLEPKLAWLADHASSDIVRRVIFRQPSLLGHNAQGNLAPKVQWLQDRLGMSEEAAWKFVGKSPGFLTLSVSETLEPKLWWLRDKLEVGLEGAAKILMTFPNLFHLSIEASLEPKLWWVRDALGLDRPDAAAILRRCPQIFGASLKDTLEPKLPWLAARLRTDKQRIAGIVKKYPQILMYSIERNLAPTIDFFEFEMGEVQPDELVDRLEMKPSALAASIEKRLLPRVSKMRTAGIEPRFSRDFRNIAVQTDAEFRAWMVRTKAKSLRTADDRPPTDESRPPSPGVELASISIGECE